MISKLHLILRPFLLRRMKEDVEQMLPRKKEIILYVNMTELQKQMQDHLINKTLENYLIENTENCKFFFKNLIIEYSQSIDTFRCQSSFIFGYFFQWIDMCVRARARVCVSFRILINLYIRLVISWLSMHGFISCVRSLILLKGCKFS